ncbi:MAG: hypothetical protein KBF89_05375 [Acidimicrobiia bacterium]|nr:hypothetical protein [Acidimicrobiia bacterium]
MPRGYMIGPAYRKKLLMGLRTIQIALLFFSGICVLIGFMSGSLVIGAILGSVFIGAAFMPIGGRVIDEWVLVMYNWISKGTKKQRTTQTASAFVGSEAASRKALPPPVFKGVKLLKVGIGDGRTIGVIKDSTEGSYSAVISLKGDAFALLDADEQEQRLGQWSQILASFARDGTPVHRIQWIERAIPEDGDQIAKYYQQEQDMDPLNPIAVAYQELIADAGPVTTNHEIYIVMSISQGKSAKAIKAAGGGDNGACEVLLSELNNMYAHLTGAAVQLIGTLSPEEIALMFRVGFEPNKIQELTKAAKSGHGVTTDIWPSAVDEQWSYIRTDSCYHASLWISEWPRTEVGADFFAPLLLYTHATRSICMIMEPLAPSKIFHEVETAKTTMMADKDLKQRAGFVLHQRSQRDYEELERRELELTQGHGPYRFSAYVVCSGESLEQLEHTLSEVEQAGHQSRILLRRLYGEQASTFATSFPLGRGLR